MYQLVAVDLGSSAGGSAVLGASILGHGIDGRTLGLGPALYLHSFSGGPASRLIAAKSQVGGGLSGKEVFSVENSGKTTITTTATSSGGTDKALAIDANVVPSNVGSYHSGVYSETSNGTGPRGVYGRVIGDPPQSNGIRGWIQTAGANRYAMFSSGDYGGSAGKFFLQPHPSDPSKEIRFACLEGNESGTYCRGTDQIVDGVCTIDLPEDFRLASEEEEITAQVTALQGPATIWVELQSRDRIVVRSTDDVSFNWFVNGVRRGWNGLETIIPNASFVPGMDEEFGEPAFAQFRPAYRQILVENGTLNADFRPNMETAARLGWIPEPREPELTPEEELHLRKAELVEAGLLTPEGHVTPLSRRLLGAKGD